MYKTIKDVFSLSLELELTIQVQKSFTRRPICKNYLFQPLTVLTGDTPDCDNKIGNSCKWIGTSLRTYEKVSQRSKLCSKNITLSSMLEHRVAQKQFLAVILQIFINGGCALNVCVCVCIGPNLSK